MQDNISCALITAFERQYDTSWDDPKLRNERLAMRYGWTAAMEAKQCLHQIQEPAAAEQAAWHAGLDEGRAQAAPAAVAVPAEVMGLLEALESMVDVCEGHDFDGAPSDAHMEKARAAISTYRAALAATPAAAPVDKSPELQGSVVDKTVNLQDAAAAPVVLPEPAYKLRVNGVFQDQIPAAHAFGLPDGEYSLFTEQQLRALLATATGLPAQAFQQRVQPWMMACFGPEISADSRERNHRFLEEALELVQSCGCTASEAHQLVDYVYGRPWGEPAQEAGGVMVTLAALCLANGLDMHACGETELARIWTKVEAIRAKQAAKPKHSPLPMQAHQTQDALRLAFVLSEIRRGGMDALTAALHDLDGFPLDHQASVEAIDRAAIAAAKGEGQ